MTNDDIVSLNAENGNLRAQVEALRSECDHLEKVRAENAQKWSDARAKLDNVNAQLKDYQTRCQVWADQAAARDKYVHELEGKLGIEPFKCQSEKISDRECPKSSDGFHEMEGQANVGERTVMVCKWCEHHTYEQ